MVNKAKKRYHPWFLLRKTGQLVAVSVKGPDSWLSARDNDAVTVEKCVSIPLM